MKKSVVKRLLKVCQSKLESHTQSRFRHFTFIFQYGKCLGMGMNNNKKPPVHYGYRREKGHVPKFHSEIDAYIRTRGIMDKNEGFEILNFRLNRHGEVRNCKPCERCVDLMFAFGCKKIYFLNPDGLNCLVYNLIFKKSC